VQVLESLEKVRSLLTCPSNLRVHMAAHIAALSAHLNNASLVDVWINQFIPPGVTSSPDRYVIVCMECCSFYSHRTHCCSYSALGSLLKCCLINQNRTKFTVRLKKNHSCILGILKFDGNL